MRIAWIYEDEEYNERLSEYIRNNKDIAISFCFFVHYSEFIDRTDTFDFVILEHTDISRANSIYPIEKLVCIATNRDIRYGEFTHINIYQNIDNLVLDINLIMKRKINGNAPMEIFRDKAIITAIYSASGGAGKSIFSKQISKVFSELNEKVLLINLEMFSGDIMQLGVSSLSELILLIKLHEKFNDPVPLRRFIISMNGIDTIPSFIHPTDALSITGDDINNVIAYLSPLYDRIVFDLDVELSSRVIAIFNCCDELIEVMQNHESAVIKHSKFIDVLVDLNVSNKHRLFIPQNNIGNFNDYGYLEEVREWYKSLI